MKTRPAIAAIATGNTTRTSLQCRRILHVRAIAPTLSCQIWRDGLRRGVQSRETGKSWESHARRYKSTATTAATQSSYGREPPPPAKTSKSNVPAKPPPSSKNSPARHNINPPTTLSRAPQVPVLKAKANLSPPSFTYAPDLAVPTRQPNQSFFSYIWKAGRSYLSFYKTGVSNVRQTSKLARSLRAKATAQGKDVTEVLTRAEWQIVLRNRQDMLRLPAFGIIFLAFGEWTPLLVMYITPLIPEPCRIPSQVHRGLVKEHNLRNDRQRRIGINAMSTLR